MTFMSYVHWVFLLCVGAAVAACWCLVFGNPAPLIIYVSLIVSLFVMLMALLHVPRLVLVMRGYRGETGWYMTPVGEWKAVFSSRKNIERFLAYSEVRDVIPKPPADIYEWLGKDARRVFAGISQAAHRADGGRFHVTGQLTEIRDAGIRDFDTLLGYFEVASIDASIYAMKEDIPIDYARVLLP